MKMSRYKCSEAATRLFPALPDLKLKKKSYDDDIKRMSKVQFIILGCVAIIFFVTYLLISRFSKINGPSKSDYSK